MIIIVSERSDASTNTVLDWLRYYGTPYIIVYPDTPIVFHSIAIGNDSFVISIDGQVISADDLKYIWYRRGTLSMMTDGNFNRLSQLLNNAEFYKFLHMEHEFVVSFFWKFNREKIFMNSYSDDFVNKLYVLFKANLHGLDTPESLVCAVKEKLIAFFEKHKEIIVKPIFNNPHIVIKEECFFLIIFF